MRSEPQRGRDRNAEPFFASREQVDTYHHLTVRPFEMGNFTASRVTRDRPGMGLTTPNSRSDVWLIAVNLRAINGKDMWCDERHLWRGANPVGGLAILDQRHAWIADMPDEFDLIQIFMPSKALSELADELCAPPIETLYCPIETPPFDPTMHHLALSIVPAFARPREASTLFVDHVFIAISAHLAETYGELCYRRVSIRGGLAPWQQRRVTELMLDDLRTDPSLADLASACGISVRHLARAFKATTGLPPHRWLLERRVDRAKELLEKTDDTLSDIALACGFADQSHLTRVFRSNSGSSPGAWRRQRLS